MLKNNNKLTLILLAALSVMVVGISVLYFVNKSEMNEIVTGLNEEKQVLVTEFQSLALNYDSLQTSNDTMNTMLMNEREKVAQLLEELQTVKSTNASKIREMQKELTTMRTVLKSFVIQIDSLNTKNQELTKENNQYRQQNAQITNDYKVLEKEKVNLSQKVDIASKLETKNISAEGLTDKDKPQRKASRVAKIRLSGTLLKNVTASVGNKKVYARILRPDGELLCRTFDDKFKFEGKMITFSAVRDIEYGGEDVAFALYYCADEGELIAGNYTADLFADGNNIGTINFELK